MHFSDRCPAGVESMYGLSRWPHQISCAHTPRILSGCDRNAVTFSKSILISGLYQISSMFMDDLMEHCFQI